MGAADFHNRGKPLLLFGKHIAQAPHGRQQAIVKHLHGSNVHRRGEGVVGGLSPIDIIIGMDRHLGAHDATGQFNGPVGDNLVGVHV